jgi:lysophospholipid acyltransferase (LPLAT)-like uncharacterized protein
VNRTTSNWKQTKRRWLNRLAAALGPFLFKGLAATWRTTRFQSEHLDAKGTKGQRALVAVWHESIPTGTVLHRNRGYVALVSMHRDGQMISTIMNRLGFITVRGSSSKGGSQALREMLAAGREPIPLVITPDGPRGPAHSVAPGTLFLAAMLGRPVIAYGFACNRMWRAKSWDRMVLPKPFCKIAVGFSEPLFVPREAVRDEALMAEYQKKLFDQFELVHQQAEEILAGKQSSS